MKQKWICEKCGKTGEIEYDMDVGVFQMVEAIFNSHQKTNPTCKWDNKKIKLEKL